jgi:hypothetical protein
LHRIDTDTKEVDKHGSGKHGFTEGNPATGTAATQVSEEWLDAVQEEIAEVIEDAGITLSKADNTQLRQAIDLKTHNNMVISNWSLNTTSKSFALYGVAEKRPIDSALVADAYAVGAADGTDAYVVYSTDGGATWTETTNPKNFDLNDVVFDSSVSYWVAVGVADGTDAYICRGNVLALSSESTNPKNFDLYAIESDDAGRLIAVGAADGTDAYIVTSTNGGSTWTEQTNPKNFALNGVAYGSSTWVAVGGADGTDAYIVYSTDAGTTWNEATNGSNVTLNDVAFGNGTFVAVGEVDSGSPYIVTSTDGISWSTRTLSGLGALNSVAYKNNMFVAVGDHVSDTWATNLGPLVASSPDGANWTWRPVESGGAVDAHGVSYVRNRWVFTGTSGYVGTSLRE